MSLDFRNAKICSPSSLSKHSKGCIEPGRYHGGKYFPLFFNREKLPFFWNESAPFSGLKVLFFLDRLNYQWQDSKKKSVIFLNCDDQWWQKRGAFFPTKLKVWGHSPHNWSQWHSATEAPLIHHNMQHDWAGKTVILFPDILYRQSAVPLILIIISFDCDLVCACVYKYDYFDQRHLTHIEDGSTF